MPSWCKLAERAGAPLAAAIFFEGGGWLYGRYWGTAKHEDALHFEACYYQGIEYCIERGLQFFDPGTQGEHKIARGFEPTRTTSAHWLEHAGFSTAVRRYLEREREAIDAYIASAQQHLPFQRSCGIGGMIPWLRPTDPPDAFPRVERALSEPDGLLCAGGDLTPARLLAAYRRGIFPWYSEGQPILWWSPDPRLVLFPTELRISRSLAKTLRNRGFRITLRHLLSRKSRPSARGAATVPSKAPGSHRKCMRLTSQLHGLGHAHSVEVWDGDQLVGGLYGIKLGTVFFGESMFSTARDASKVALCHLVEALRTATGDLIDCQVASEHLFSLGARLIPRAEFIARLDGASTCAPAASGVGRTPGKHKQNRAVWPVFSLQCGEAFCRIRAAFTAARMHGEGRCDSDGRASARDAAQHDVPGSVAERSRSDCSHLRQDA